MAKACLLMPSTPSYILLVDEDIWFRVLNYTEHSSNYGSSKQIFALCLLCTIGHAITNQSQQNGPRRTNEDDLATAFVFRSTKVKSSQVCSSITLILVSELLR